MIRSQLHLAAFLAAAIGLWLPHPVGAHNNPSFREDLLLSVEVTAESGFTSDAFELSWGKKTVQLIWRIDSANKDAIQFAVAQAGKVVLEGLHHDSPSARIKGGDIRIVDVAGADGASFTVHIYAKVLDRSVNKQKTGALQNLIREQPRAFVITTRTQHRHRRINEN